MFEYFITNYASVLMDAVLCAIFGMLGIAVKRLAQNILDTDAKKTVAKLAVQFVEQAWKNLHGHDKLQKALETARIMLDKKGIIFDAEEMEVIIEAAVAEFNEAFKKPLISENANSVRRTELSDQAYTDGVEAGIM